MPENVETTEWGVMELAPRNHGNTLPKNQVQRGQVRPCGSREDAENTAALRAKCNALEPLAVVARTVTVSPWTTIDLKVGV